MKELLVKMTQDLGKQIFLANYVDDEIRSLAWLFSSSSLKFMRIVKVLFCLGFKPLEGLVISPKTFLSL
jgi:hypothetical protein